jgi:hypothetical protein
MKLFKKTKFMHMPCSFGGFTITVLAILFLVNLFMAIDRNSHSSSDTLYNFFPYIASIFLLYEWLATKTSK